MSDTPGRLQFHQPREYSLLEILIRDRRFGIAGCATFAASALAVALAVFHLYIGLFGVNQVHLFAGTHLAVMMVLAVLVRPLFRSGIGEPVIVPGDRGNTLRLAGLAIDLVLIALVIAVHAYVVTEVESGGLEDRMGDPNDTDVLAGCVLLLLVLEMTRRVVGWTLVLLAAFFIIHMLFGDHFVGMLYKPPKTLAELADNQFVEIQGIFGVPLQVAATYIVLFIIYGAILIRSGAGRFFIELAMALTGHRIGGPAKASVVASAFMGTVSGTATGNVVTTGSFTIPLMKRLGYRPKFAAAVEACASSGGQITPPIMGAAAFIIAEYMRVPYFEVVVAAIVPTFLYFATMYFMVHLEADKHKLRRLSREDLPGLVEVLRGGWHLLLSLGVLVGLLVYGYTATFAAVWSTITLLLLTFVNPRTRMSPVDLLSALETGVRNSLPVTIACACAGIIIGSMLGTGVGLDFTNAVISWSGGSLFVMLILTGIAGIVLGMGMTTTAVYITVAALIVPALIQIGVTPMSAHLFAFYFGVVSSITPPVALAAFAAAAIAGSPQMSTAVESSRVGIAKYLVPFVFVYNPALVFEGPLWLTAYSGITALGGVWLLSLALEGWYRGPLRPLPRLVVAAAAILLMYPPFMAVAGISGYMLNGAGATVLLMVITMRFRAPLAAGEAGE